MARRDHVAIIAPDYLNAILAGRKVVESRLTLTRREPFGQIAPGDRLYFKASGGAFGATAIAARVDSHEEMTPANVRALRRTLGRFILGTDAYWRAKLTARYATLIWLERVEPIAIGPDYRAHPSWASGRAWYTLPENWCIYHAARRAA